MNIKQLAFILIILIMLLLSGCGQSLIAFSSSRDGNFEICTVTVTGEDYKNLTKNPGNDHSPAWSPDGRKIVFYSDRDKEKDNDEDYNTEIYIMNSNGSSQKRLTQNKYADIMPAFSPKGDKIAFSSDRKERKVFDIFLINPDGSDEVNITDSSDGNEKHPDWIDSDTILFERIYFQDGMKCQIYSMNIDGTGLTKITDTVYKDHSPVCSPDGSKIAFSREEGDASNIYISNLDGSGVEKISSKFFPVNESPAWSPDGRKIAYSSLRNGSRQIIIINLSDKSEQSLLNPSPLDDILPAWSPY